LKIQENIPLAPFTTLQVGGPARYFLEARSETEVKDAVAWAAERHLSLFVLGGGSNLVIADAGWPGLVLKIGLPGIHAEKAGTSTDFSAGAGEDWDKLVALSVAKGCAGIECLSGIPGTVGGTPVQNVGAYGQEVSQTITGVRLLDLVTGKTLEFDKAACEFAYRTSVFNTSQRGRYIVLGVTFRLRSGGEPTIEYADLKNFFSNPPVANPGLQQVRDAVRSIRQSKAMLLVEGDEDCRSAGSFFKNPLVNLPEADRVQALAAQRAPGKPLPVFRSADGQFKLAAAWLVEQAGFYKGYSRGPVGISRKHSLAIVNRGGATAQDVIALKNEVVTRVMEAWGVRLQPEPVFVGFDAS
jgi:UDP-N-acetylmuramate dehydrogenase